MKHRFSLAVLALLLTACTPSLNLQVGLPELAGPGFRVALSASTTTGPAPLTAEFTADVQESSSYAWYVNDRKLSRKQRLLTYTFREAGSYQVTVAATNTVGETDTDTVTVEVVNAEDTEDTTVERLSPTPSEARTVSSLGKANTVLAPPRRELPRISSSTRVACC